MTRSIMMLALLFCAVLCSGARGKTADLAFRLHVGASLPLAVSFKDERGRPVTLGKVFDKRPVILIMDYLHCRSLCSVTLRGLIATLDRMPLEAGRDFELVAISIDPRDTPHDAAVARAKYMAAAGGAAGSGFHFLTGTAAAVRDLAERVGFPYRYDPQLGIYLHPAGFIVVTPDGMISSYVEGVSVTPAKLIDALAGAAQEKRINPLTRVLLYCHISGASLGRFTVPVLAAFTLANIAGGISLVVLFVGIMRRRHG